MKDYWKAPATVLAVIALAACSANGGFPGGSRGGGGGGDVDCDATPDDPACQMDETPDISTWNPTQRGANSALYETGLSCSLGALSGCVVPAEDDNASYDGDGETSSSVSYNFAGLGPLSGNVVTATFDTGLVNASGNNVAAVELEAPSAFGSGYTITVTTAIGGTPTDDPAQDSASASLGGDFISGLDRILVGFQNTLPYDQIIMTIAVDGADLLDEITVYDVVTAAVAPPEDMSGDAAQ